MTWTNSDGLYIKFGQEEAVVTAGGEVQPFGDQLVISFNLDHTDITTTAASILMDNVVIPVGFQLQKIELTVEEAFDSAGDAFVMNMGTIDLDRSSNGSGATLINTEVQADIDAIGDIVTYTLATAGASGAGSLVGTVFSTAKLITVDYDTAAPTAGHAKVRLFGHIETVP